MTDEIDEQSDIATEKELEKYAARTRRSLILRLKDWQDQKSWDEFYRTYWRLIYMVAIKAGLKEHEAWDVVQETVLTIAKQSRKGLYNPEKGSFKSWLWNITRWRINDQFRNRKKEGNLLYADAESSYDPVGEIPDAGNNSFDKIWEREWQGNIMKAAMERVKMKVSPRQFQIFDYNVLRGMRAGEVTRKLGVSIAQVYLAKHRVGSILRKEIEFIRSQGEGEAK